MRVRIHLNLNHPERAENVVKCQSGNAWPTVAYATHMVLHNVTTHIEEDKRSHIANVAGTTKNPCAYLEGDLVSWTGRVRDKAPATPKEEIAHLEVESQKIEKLYDPNRLTVGFNPKKAACFYKNGNLQESFESAKSAVVVHWNFGMDEPQFKPMPQDSLVKNPLPPTHTERVGIHRGQERTKDALKRITGISGRGS